MATDKGRKEDRGDDVSIYDSRVVMVLRCGVGHET